MLYENNVLTSIKILENNYFPTFLVFSLISPLVNDEHDMDEDEVVEAVEPLECVVFNAGFEGCKLGLE